MKRPERQELINLYEKLHSLKAISKKFGVYDTTVGDWFKKYNIPYNHDNRNFSRTDMFNESFFDDLNEKSLYWLGFIAADGNVAKNFGNIRINLARKDRAHLIKFKKDINSTSPIVNYIHISSSKNIKNKKYQGTYFNITSAKIKRKLIELNIVPQKGQTFTIPKEIAEHKDINIFYRGYIDGDGCIRFDRQRKQLSLDIRASKEFLETFNDTIYQKLNVDVKNKKTWFDKTYRIRYMGNNIVPIILKWLYQDVQNNHNARYLDRKYDFIKQYL